MRLFVYSCFSYLQVHIVCALWHKNTVFNDISQMGEVDVTGVFTQKPKIRDVLGSFNLPQLRQLLDMPDVDAPASGSAPFAGPESLTSPTSSTCSECGTSMGATLSCASPGCSHSFHPLCAWYSGLYAVVTLDPEASLLYNPDPNSRGIHYALYCQSHLPPDVSASGRNRLEQRQLRCKYRVSESDVSQVRASVCLFWMTDW